MQKVGEYNSPILLLIAESCSMNCELLTESLERDGQLSVVASALTSAEILEAYAAKKPDVCVISSVLKGEQSAGFAATRKLRTVDSSARVILLLDSPDRPAVVEAFRSGAMGVFSREEPFRTLHKCIHKVHQGQIWASNLQLRYLVETLAATPPPPITDAHGVNLLTKREESLVQLIAEGRTNRDISRELGLSEHTVRNYLFKIFNKLGTSNRLELALYAINQRDVRRKQAAGSR
jgi:two-component system, NarL family, nitrate/nitrite response regulator NarL